MAEPEANIFKRIRQISPTVKEGVGQKEQKREDPAITEFLHLLKKQPEAAERNDGIYGRTPLHFACQEGSPFEVVAALLKAWPDAAKQKDSYGQMPLHWACSKGSSFEVVAALLKAWPDAAKQRTRKGTAPLHAACLNTTPFEVVAALLKAWPEVVKEKDSAGNTPLQMACRKNSSFEVTFLLLNTWLSYKENRTESAIAALQRDAFNLTRDAEMLFSHLFALYNNNADNPSPNEIIDYFIHMEMWNGATLVLGRHPAAIKTMGLDTKVMADFLSTVGRRCSLKTMWEVLRNEQDLLGGV